MVAGTILQNGILSYLSGDVSGTGLVLVMAEGVMEITPFYSTPTLSLRRINNAGILRVGNARESVVTVNMGSSGLSNISNSGVMDLISDGAFTWDRDGTQPTLLNTGVLRKSNSFGRTDFDIKFNTTNSSTIDIKSGTLRINGGGKTQALSTVARQIPFIIAPEAAVEFYSNYIIDVPSAFGGGGRASLGSGIFTVLVEVVAEDFDFSAGSLNGSGVFRLTKSIAWTGAGMSGTGTTMISAGWNWSTKTFTAPFNAALHEMAATGTTS